MAYNNPSNLDYSNLGSTDNIIVRVDGTNGRAIQSSAVSIDDFGILTGAPAIIFGTPFTGGFSGTQPTMAGFGAQTTDATVTTLTSVSIASGESVFMKAFIHATRSDHSETIGGEILYLARNSGSGAVEVGAPITNIIEDSSGSPTFDADVSGNDVRIRVTGEAGKTWNWACFLITYKVLTNA